MGLRDIHRQTSRLKPQSGDTLMTPVKTPALVLRTMTLSTADRRQLQFADRSSHARCAMPARRMKIETPVRSATPIVWRLSSEENRCIHDAGASSKALPRAPLTCQGDCAALSTLGESDAPIIAPAEDREKSQNRILSGVSKDSAARGQVTHMCHVHNLCM
jgi:hypothetical protein